MYLRGVRMDTFTL
jgi:hypothetical protein